MEPSIRLTIYWIGGIHPRDCTVKGRNKIRELAGNVSHVISTTWPSDLEMGCATCPVLILALVGGEAVGSHRFRPYPRYTQEGEIPDHLMHRWTIAVYIKRGPLGRRTMHLDSALQSGLAWLKVAMQGAVEIRPGVFRYRQGNGPDTHALTDMPWGNLPLRLRDLFPVGGATL